MKSLVNQLLDSPLGGRPYERSHASIPASFDFDIRGQTVGVEKPLDIDDCLLVERGDPGSQRFDKLIEFSIRQRPIHITVAFGQVAVDVIPSQKHFQGPSPSHEPRQSCHRSTARYQTNTYFPLGEDGFFTTRKAHVARQRELTTVASRPPPDQRDRNNSRTRQAHEDIRPRWQSGGA